MISWVKDRNSRLSRTNARMEVSHLLFLMVAPPTTVFINKIVGGASRPLLHQLRKDYLHKYLIKLWRSPFPIHRTFRSISNVEVSSALLVAVSGSGEELGGGDSSRGARWWPMVLSCAISKSKGVGVGRR
jgi:hypothetical protein